MGWGFLDYVPVVSNVKGAIEGDYKQAVHGPVKEGYEKLSGKPLPDPILEGLTREPEKFEEEKARLAANAQSADRHRLQFANDLAYANVQQRPAPVIKGASSPGVQIATSPFLNSNVAQVAAPTAVAAKAAGTSSIGAQSIAPPTYVAAQDVIAPQMGAAQGLQAAQVAPAATARQNTAVATTLNPAAQVQADTMSAAQLDPAALAFARQAQSAKIAADQQAQLRAGQVGLVSSLQGAAAGTSGPTAAEAVLRKGIDEAIAAQSAMAGQARGSNVALAQRQATLNASSLMTKGAQEAAILRAQEQQAARKELGEALTASRSQDIGLATSQAGFENQTGLANLDAGTRVDLANAAARNQNLLTSAGFQQDANKANLDAVNRARLANQEASNQVNLAQGQMSNAVELANLDASTKTNLADAAAENSRSALQANLDQSAGQFTAEQQNARDVEAARQSLSAQTANQDANLKANLSNQGVDLAAATTNAQMAQDAATKNASNTLQTNLTNAGFANDIAKSNQQAQMAAAQANAEAENTRAEFKAKLGVDISQFNAQQQNQMAMRLKELNAQIDTANANNNLEALRIANAEKENLRQAIMGAQKLSIDANSATFQVTNQAAQNQTAKDNQWLSAGGSALSFLSDADRKEMIQTLPDDDKDVQQFLDVLNAYSYRYKDPEQEGAAPGKRFGITVQDMEKSKIGKSLVFQTPSGKKVNVPQATGALMAVVGSLNKRIKQLESKQ